MKIIILTQYFQPEMGAPQSRLFELAKGLQNAGNAVEIVTAMPNYPTGKIFNQYAGRFSSSETIEGIKIKRFWLYASNSKKSIPRIISMLSFSFTCLFSWRYVRNYKPDYFLTESPPLTLAFSGLILSRLSSAKHIMNVSDIWPLSAKELGAVADGFLYRQLEKLEKYLYKKSFLVAGQSQEIIGHISDIVKGKTYLFRNGVDVNRFAARKENRETGQKKRIVYAGLLGVAQGVYDICLELDFKNLDVEFHIYGNGAQQQEIANFVKHNPERGVYLHEAVKRDEIPSILQSFDATIIPLVKNIYGAVPSKIYEAMAAGLPVLFSGEGEGAAIIKQYEAGLVSLPGEWHELGNNIRLLFSDESKQRVFSENGLKAAKETFDRNKQISLFNTYLQQCL